jgi:hypothetical protein
MNRQQIYNQVKIHLLTQMHKSEAFTSEGDGQCVYRHVDGYRCAMGALIPDHLYDERMDDLDIETNTSISAVLENFPELVEFFNVENQEDINFLATLQQLHDCYTPEQWKTQLELFATVNNLEP